jgi:hypothetical protein
MVATSSQHTRHKLVTSLATCTLCQRRREGAQHGKRVRNMGKGVRNMEKCPQHNVWMLVATCSSQARNMFATNSQHRSQHVHYVRGGGWGATWKKCSQHGKRYSQHSQHALQHYDPTADMFHDSNRVVRKVSDASARIGRPSASSSVFFTALLEKRPFVPVHNPNLYQVLNWCKWGLALYQVRYTVQIPHICTGWSLGPVQTSLPPSDVAGGGTTRYKYVFFYVSFL